VSYVGATPVFADFDPTSWCITADRAPISPFANSTMLALFMAVSYRMVVRNSNCGVSCAFNLTIAVRAWCLARDRRSSNSQENAVNLGRRRAVRGAFRHRK
jgi:hypothetical protein